jgi:hypothetical protein
MLSSAGGSSGEGCFAACINRGLAVLALLLLLSVKPLVSVVCRLLLLLAEALVRLAGSALLLVCEAYMAASRASGSSSSSGMIFGLDSNLD